MKSTEVLKKLLPLLEGGVEDIGDLTEGVYGLLTPSLMVRCKVNLRRLVRLGHVIDHERGSHLYKYRGLPRKKG